MARNFITEKPRADKRPWPPHNETVADLCRAGQWPDPDFCQMVKGHYPAMSLWGRERQFRGVNLDGKARHDAHRPAHHHGFRRDEGEGERHNGGGE